MSKYYALASELAVLKTVQAGYEEQYNASSDDHEKLLCKMQILSLRRKIKAKGKELYSEWCEMKRKEIEEV